MKTLLAAAALALALALPQAAAQTGAPPLDPVLEGQPERWLGAGDQNFDNIYTRQGGRVTARPTSTPPPMAAGRASRCCA